MTKATMPEPVAYLSCDTKTLDPVWGDDCVCEDDMYSPEYTGTIGRPIIFVDQAEAFAAAKVQEALEQAAKIVDDEADNARQEHYHPGLVGALECCASEIRALIPKQ